MPEPQEQKQEVDIAARAPPLNGAAIAELALRTEEFDFRQFVISDDEDQHQPFTIAIVTSDGRLLHMAQKADRSVKRTPWQDMAQDEGYAGPDAAMTLTLRRTSVLVKSVSLEVIGQNHDDTLITS